MRQVREQLVYEDDLPPMPEHDYDEWFKASIVDGVRMGPPVGVMARYQAQGIESVLYIRCDQHRGVPQLNASEASKGECGACVARDVMRNAARLVCGYCDGHFTGWEQEARRGATGSGNWVHREKGDASRHQLCVASGIHNKLAYSTPVVGRQEST